MRNNHATIGQLGTLRAAFWAGTREQARERHIPDLANLPRADTFRAVGGG
jgi:hypothetical protein